MTHQCEVNITNTEVIGEGGLGLNEGTQLIEILSVGFRGDDIFQHRSDLRGR